MAPGFWQLATSALVVLAIFSSECQAAKAKQASAYFTLCGRKNPDLEECVLKNINDLRPRILKGIPELRLAPLDPMFIPEMTLIEGQGNFRFAQTLTNLTIHGLSQFKVNTVGVRFNDTNMNIKIDMTTPYLVMNAHYEMDGQILVLPIKGSGECVLNFADVVTVANVQGSLVNRNAKQYVEVDDVHWDIRVGGANSTFHNLFNGDKTLGDATNNFLNANWKDAFATYKHLPEEAFGLVFKDLTNQVFKRYTVDELFVN